MFGAVGVALETKDISDLREELHGRLRRKNIAICALWRAMRVRAARSLVYLFSASGSEAEWKGAGAKAERLGQEVDD